MTWWRRVISRNRLESQLDAELREHFDRLVRDFVARGHSDSEARRMARLEFGGMDQVKEACRDARGTRWVDETLQDARYGLRGFRKNPGFTTVAIVTLAIGVGASLAIFNVVDALLAAAAAGAEPVGARSRSRAGSATTPARVSRIRRSASWPIAAICLRRCAASAPKPSMSVRPSALEPAGAAWVSGGYFDTLGITPLPGRLLNASDDERGAPVAAVISHGYWQRRFGGDRDVVGRQLRIEGQQVPIVGITPVGFNGAAIGEPADITLAFNAKPVLQPENDSFVGPDARWILRARASRGGSVARSTAGATRRGLGRSARANIARDISAETRQRILSTTLRRRAGARPARAGCGATCGRRSWWRWRS